MVDTANKRGSSIQVGATGPTLPIADGEIDAGDRAQTAGEYRGHFDEEEAGTPGIGGGPLTVAVFIAINRRRRRC